MILDKNGDRILAKYNANGSLKTIKAQLTIEKKINELLHNSISDTELITHGRHVIIARNYAEFSVILLADQSENELLLEEILETLTEGIKHFCGRNLKLPVLFRYYTEVLLLFDEILSDGLVVSLDSEEIVARVLMNDKWKASKNSSNRKGLFF